MNIKLIRKLNYVLFYFLIQMLALQMLFIPLQAQDPSELEQLIRQSKTRASLVQNFQKAVVHIKVEKILRNSEGQPLNNQ